MNYKYIRLEKININILLSLRVPSNIIIKYKFIIIDIDDTFLNVAFVDKDDIDITILSNYFEQTLRVYLIQENEFNKYLNIIELNKSIEYLSTKVREDIAFGGKFESTKSNLLSLFETIIETAIMKRCSDIHFESNKNSYKVRVRIDGILQLMFEFESKIALALISKIKLLSSLDIAKTYKNQEGRFSYIIMDEEYDFRVSTIFTYFGESLVIRVLDKSKSLLNINELGFDIKMLEELKKVLLSDNGLILFTGQTGSGKSTSLYAVLNFIKNIGKKIITVEDPIEYQLDLIEQIGINENMSLSFNDILRNILRLDPDILMIGEIRDAQTLKIATQSALTGHLVLSTLHTNGAVSTITRLKDMGIAEYLLSSTLKAIISQKLIRRLCSACKIEYEVNNLILQQIKTIIPNKSRFYKPNGCSECNQSGYSGRVVVAEVLILDNEFKEKINNSLDVDTINAELSKINFKTIYSDALIKSANGQIYINDLL